MAANRLATTAAPTWRQALTAGPSGAQGRASPSSSLRLFSTASPSYAAPALPRVLPVSQQTAKTTIPKTPQEQAARYPRHPLNAFFHLVAPRTEGGIPTPAAVIPDLDLGERSSSRSWRAPELRRKSSMELHQMWYILAMERNRLATKWDELKRASVQVNASQVGETIRARMKQVRKSQARVKFTLNERRLALIEAQNTARSQQTEAQLQALESAESSSVEAVELDAEQRARELRQDAAYAALEEQSSAGGPEPAKFSMGAEESAGREGVAVGQQARSGKSS
ncbi:unnamed protein product [Parajaminaea phylloscopi]